MLDERFYISLGPLKLSSIIEGTNSFLLDDNYGDEDIFLPAELGLSVKGQISFLRSKKYLSSIPLASATACFVTPELSGLIESQNIIPIISSAPKSHFARSINKLVRLRKNRNLDTKPSISETSKIHETAIISDGAVIESGVEIAPFCVIGPGVHIKSNTFIDSHTIINCAVVGSGCYIKASSVIGGSGFGISSDEVGIINIPHVGRVLIGNDVFIGSNTCIDRGFIGDTILENNTKVDNFVQIAHNCIIGAGTVIAAQVGVSGSCSIGKGVKIGGKVGFVDHINVGDFASIAAGSGVMNDIPTKEVWSGAPAMPIRDHMRALSANRKLGKKLK
jgi:UDP-3-O-[3-hydroxymyristoyl] glucosamine N-acyltransferase